MDINTPFDFSVWFYSVFISPILDILKNTVVLGYSLFSWLLGLTMLSLAVQFVRVLFGASNDRG